MSNPQTAPYGSWKSPITSDLIVAKSVGLMEIALDGGDVYWIEMRPSESGRYVIARRSPDGSTADVTPPGFNARTRVHEYGGGSCAVDAGTIIFSNFADQRLYRQRPGEEPRPITPDADLRYADGAVDGARNRLICVREDHTRCGTGILPVSDHGQDGRATKNGHLHVRQGAYLPHWTLEGATYFVTFRLADSLPHAVVQTYAAEREAILKRAEGTGIRLTMAEEKRLRELFSDKVDAYLDSGHGSCWLKRGAIAREVQEALLHFHGDRYTLTAWCVMPNHVHAVVRPHAGYELRSIVHSWKSYTANQANGVLRRSGAFWQPEYYDHLIRDGADLARCIAYTCENPQRAGLREWQWCGATAGHYRDTGILPVSDHGQDGRATATHGEAVNTICSIDLDGRTDAAVLTSGNDFYASPRLSPDGSRLAWVAWDHPNMPWDATELWVADVNADGSLGEPRRIAGGPGESIVQPEWSPGGTLHFVSDRTDWWNLYRWRDGAAEPLCPMEAEFGVPHWVFGRPMYAFAGPERIIAAFTERSTWRLADINTASGGLRILDVPYTDISCVRATETHAVFRGGSPAEHLAVVRVDLATGEREALRRSASAAVDPGYISMPEPMKFPTEGGRTAHAFFYPPRNRDYAAPAGERPPLIVGIHGGPTSATSDALGYRTQFWTSRGFAVVDVNYGGSTGYGRAYRERLKDNWGIVDVDDCVHAARWLAESGLADPDRLAIHGGSAGGYTTLAALAFRDVFKAGASYYGVSDAEALAKETHKFESRYLDGLIGPYPERRDLYQERSPIHHTGGLSCPLILFQGLEDKIVPPNQAEMMFDALKAKGVPVAYVPFEGEQHGFRKAENIKRVIDAELYFYSRVFGFELADPVEPVPIENIE